MYSRLVRIPENHAVHIRDHLQKTIEQIREEEDRESWEVYRKIYLLTKKLPREHLSPIHESFHELFDVYVRQLYTIRDKYKAQRYDIYLRGHP